MWQKETSKCCAANIHEVITWTRRRRNEDYSSKKTTQHQGKYETYCQKRRCINRPRVSSKLQPPGSILNRLLGSETRRELTNTPNDWDDHAFCKRLREFD